MDIELARTFLTVIERGSFVAAADQLHLTQSTVSARIANLERTLGCKLFVRNRAGTRLTADGHRFQRHALELVGALERARQALGVARAYRESLVVGARFGLWEGYMLDWLAAMRAAAPDVAVRAEIGFEDELMRGLIDGTLDLGVMYTPQYRPGLTVRKLFEETLILVTTRVDAAVEPGDDYVYVDWGPEFHRRHQADFPDYAGAAITVNIGWLGLRHILAHGGSGYFPERLVAGELSAGSLYRATDAPSFSQPVYAAYAAAAAESGALATAVAELGSGIPRLAPGSTAPADITPDGHRTRGTTRTPAIAQASRSSNKTLDR